jgi:hypothetical protein
MEQCKYYPCSSVGHTLTELIEICRTPKHEKCQEYLTRKELEELNRKENYEN